MSKPVFTVIEGGLLTAQKNAKKHLISAYVTDTRLMGVLAVYAHWRPELSAASLYDDAEDHDLHQFFYIDCEEMGLETYKSIVGSDREEIDIVEQALVGGLGAKKIPLTEYQLKGLLTYYKNFNKHNGLPLPQNYDEYGFVLEDEVVFSEVEHNVVMQLICGNITSDYQAVNYFLMRLFGRDYSGAAYLSEKGCPLDIYNEYHQATFCKNVIDKSHEYDDGAIAYLCESLIEMGGNYETVITEVIVKDLKIVGCRHCSGFAISSAEAAMMLAKAEFVTVYEVLLSDEDMDANIGELTVDLNSVMSTHENGRMFMAFKPTNDHVNSRIFRLSNDVKGVYYLTDFGQLLVSAYTLQDIRYMENKLKMSMLAPFLMTTAKYEFKEPVLFEFIQSDFEDFDDFLEYIRE
ncbi:MAG: hypothetical protein Q4B18_06725 [Bacillota bacterium]|nr:hypothetical protein [Bacillota bacterium]